MVCRLEFNPVGLVSEETYLAYARENVEAGYPAIQVCPPHDIPLAVVGGGPSIKRHLSELVTWPGHIWAVNQTAQWLLQFEPRCPVWLFSVDPGECIADWTRGVDRAILGSSCHPSVFRAMAGKDVRLTHSRPVPGLVDTLAVDDGSGAVPRLTNLMGNSSVCRTFLPALVLGYADVTFFGCEGSLENETHAYRDEHETRPRQMIIRAGDNEYLTTPDYYMTTQFLARVMKEYPKLKEKSGGLLRGMLNHWDTWEVVAMSAALRDQVCPEATDPYVPKRSN